MSRISIIIPVYKDESLLECINSIDSCSSIEIIVVYNGTPKELIKKYDDSLKKDSRIKVIKIATANKSKAYNTAIKQVTTNKIIFMDSDCTFCNGCIKNIESELDNSMLVRGRVNFLFNNKRNKVVARARHIHTNLKRAYTPPLGMTLSCIQKIGMPLFCESLSSTEDFDLEMRRRLKKIPLSYQDNSRVNHPPISIRQELKIANRYGIGHAIGVSINRPGYYPPEKVRIKDFIVFFNKYRNKYGVCTTIFLLFWNIEFNRGYKKGVKKNDNLQAPSNSTTS